MMRDRLSPVPSIGADPRAAISFKRNRRAIIAEGTNFSGAVYFQSDSFGNKTNQQVEDHRPARGVGLPLTDFVCVDCQWRMPQKL
jgi:hypothetical protein